MKEMWIKDLKILKGQSRMAGQRQQVSEHIHAIKKGKFIIKMEKWHLLNNNKLILIVQIKQKLRTTRYK